jgi:hypothetical protein
MPVEILALIVIAALLVGAVVGMSIEQFLSMMRRRAWKAKNRGHWREQRTIASWPWDEWRRPESSKTPDAADQLRIVMGANFTVQPLLNKHEARVFRELDRLVIARNPSWQVMAQVCLGEILRAKDEAAYRCINAKRVDLLLVDGDQMPRHAIEYQGHGHHQGTAAARDAVKKEALRRAGIGYAEVIAGRTRPADLRRLVDELVGPETPPLQPVLPDGQQDEEAKLSS